MFDVSLTTASSWRSKLDVARMIQPDPVVPLTQSLLHALFLFTLERFASSPLIKGAENGEG